MLNDAIRLDSNMDYTVRYTRREDIRRAVLVSELAASADVTSWFDQLRMPGCEAMMGVEDEAGGQYSLLVAAMGYTNGDQNLPDLDQTVYRPSTLLSPLTISIPSYFYLLRLAA